MAAAELTSLDAPPSPKKRRIPKACAGCRQSKVRCDGGKPCTRCRNAKVTCDYVKQPTDQLTERLAQIQQQVDSLSSRVPDATTAITLLQLQQQQTRNVDPAIMDNNNNNFTSPYPSSDFPVIQNASPVSLASGSHHSHSISSAPQLDVPFHSGGYRQNSVLPTYTGQSVPTKRKYRDFELNLEEGVDVVARGLISFDDALLYFGTFFQGCDRFVPVFDSKFDTFASVRTRSAMLFDTICAVGCRAEHGSSSQQYQNLSNATKGPICGVMLGTTPPSVEVIQALLVDACYSEKGWLLTSLALKMSLELGLADAYSQLCARVLESDDGGRSDGPDGHELFRKARVWFGVFVVENILSIDCGKKPGIRSGNGMRRCRVLLNHPSRSILDFRLLAQVELNSIRALAHEKLSPGPGVTLADQELSDIVQGTRLDLSIWLSDWINLVESKIENENERASLIINMKIQRDWSEMTMLCKGLQGIGMENIAIMSDEQRNFIHLAKTSAHRHLSIILSNPKLYLGSLRYGMDFVWAKCAFTVLLLLKLARLFPETTDMSVLITDAKTLLRELSQIEGSSNIYFRILSLSVEKFERALRGDFPQSESRGSGQQRGELDGLDAEMDFQSYVPKEFILEWNFPGLTFCWVPFEFGELFMDFGGVSAGY